MKEVLIGTTNPSKVEKYRNILNDRDYTFVTPADIGITEEPDETGADQIENASVKARFYGRYHDCVICMDSGLHIKDLPPDDPRQPGLHVRSPFGRRLDDDEMLDYYIRLVSSLGGRAAACWLDGTAVWNRGRITTLAEPAEAAEEKTFFLIDKPSGKRHAGWPMDSISLYADSGRYFTDDEPRHMVQSAPAGHDAANEYRKRLYEFLVSSIEG